MVLYCSWLAVLPNVFQTLHSKMPDSLVRISVIQQLERFLQGKLRPLLQEGCHLSYLQFACKKQINRLFQLKLAAAHRHTQSICIMHHYSRRYCTAQLPPFCTAQLALWRHL